MSPPLHVLVVKTGTTAPPVAAAHGDYEIWFLAGLAADGVRSTVVDAWRGAPLPDLAGVDGVVLTGSPLSVRDEAPWMAALAAWALDAAARVPVLAVCFGHQLLGEALGGRVEPNPAGGEYGTIAVALTPEGRDEPLFAGLPPAPRVQSTHRDALVRPPTAPGVVCLARTENTPWQAFAWGPHLRAVQFHPELPARALADLLALRGDPGEVFPSPHGHRILHNWIQACVAPARAAR